MSFIVKINGLDHLEISYQSKSINLTAFYKKLFSVLNKLDNRLHFECSDSLGYITTLPSNLGSTLETAYTIKMPNTCQRIKNQVMSFENIKDLGQDFENIEINPPVTESGEIIVTTVEKLGTSEAQALKNLIETTNKLIDAENRYAINEQI